ncbi:MAG: VCBS repeat-containing protein, partial [Calditrichaeota bacterium]|nr:VCBS repeat-containing protein [Calditrichota bacterium]
MESKGRLLRAGVLLLCALATGAGAQQIRFTDVTAAKAVKGYLVNGVSVYGHGVAMADITGDGLPEIYVSQANEGTSSYPEVLYISKSGSAYTEEASRRGLYDSYGIGSHGIVFFDLDNDDDWDVFNGNTTARNRLYRNRGNGYFDDITVAAGIKDWAYGTRGVVAFDANNDGYMDLYCVGAEVSANKAEPNEFYINLKNGTFQLADWGLKNVNQDGFTQQGVTAVDIDNDGDVDVYISRRDDTHDGRWGAACNLLFINNGDGTFSEQAAQRGVRGSFWNDGATFADYDNDGDLDLFVIGQNRYLGKVFVYRNRGDGYFDDVTNTLNIAGRGYSVFAFDADNDGDLDLYIPQHFGSETSPNRCLFYRNDGGTFVSLSSTGAELYAYDPRGGAISDVDGDGDLDIYFADANKGASASYSNRLLRNDTQTTNRWLKVYGRGPKGDKGGVGTKVWVFDQGCCDDSSHLVGYRQMLSAYGYLCQDDYVLHFGLGQRDTVDVKIVMLDGTTLRARKIPANSKLYFTKPAELALLDGNGQQGPGNVPLPAPFRVKVTDQYGKKVVGAEVTFTAVTGNGRFLEAQPVSTDREGIAAARFVMGSVGQTQTVRATCAAVPGVAVEFTATITPHKVAGKVRYPDGSIPPTATFTAYKSNYPDEVLTQSSAGCGYSGGTYWIQCENFPHTWAPGETLLVEVRDGAAGYVKGSVVFSTAAVDSLNLVISVFTQQITVTTTPPGLQVVVDGQPYVAPQTFAWIRGSSHTLSAPSPQQAGPGTRQVFNAWSDGGAQTHAITVPASNQTFTAQFMTQHELTVVSSYGAPFGAGWYAAGSSATFGVSTPDTSTPGIKRLLVGWTGTGTGAYTGPNAVATVVMNNPIQEQAEWRTQYYLAVTSPYGSPTGQGWYDEGSMARFGVTTPEVHGTTRYVLTGWSGHYTGTSATDSLRMDGPKSVVASWATEHYLSVNSPYGVPSGQGWYRQGSTAQFGVVPGVVVVNGGVRRVFLRWAGSGAGSYSGTDTLASVVVNNPITETAQWKTQYRLTTAVNPPGGGSMVPEPPGLWCDSMAVVTLSATPNSGGGYIFAGWSGALSGTANPASLTMNGPKSVTANFTPPGHVRITTDPPGLTIVVDGVTYPAPVDFAWAVGSAHTIAVQSPQAGPPGLRYVFSTWSDGGAQSHTVVVAGEALYTARFTTEYYLSLARSPEAGGTLVPAPPGGWYAQGTTVVLTATPSQGYVWAGWSGDLVGLGNPATVVMNRPLSVTANFAALRQILLSTVPEGREIVVDGTPYAAPQTFSWPKGSRHTIAAPSPQSVSSGTRYVFQSWSDGGEQSHEVVVDEVSAYVATFLLQHYLTTRSNPPEGGSVTPAPPGEWFAAGSQVSVTASSNQAGGYAFWGWTGDLQGMQTPTTVLMDGPREVIANFGIGQYAPPLLVCSYPAAGAIGVPRNASVYLALQGRTGGMDVSSLEMEVDGLAVLRAGVDQTNGRVSALMVGDRYTVNYRPRVPYARNAPVTVHVRCSDLGYHLGGLDTTVSFVACEDTAFVMVRKTINQLGGEVLSEQTGLELHVPAGALSAPIPVEVGFIWHPPALPESLKVIDLYHYLGPEGLEFADSITIAIEYSADQLAEAGVARAIDLPCYRYSSRQGVWSRVPVVAATDSKLFVRTKELCYITLAAGKKSAVQVAESAVPQRLELLQNYPNPFNPQTVLEYHLPAAGWVRLAIY